MATKRRSRKNYNRGMKLIRRAHLYAGLILLPWVLFFGVSGFLFNHNTVFFGGGERVEASYRAAAVAEVTKFSGLDVQQSAESIVEQLNEASNQAGFQLDGGAQLSGWIVFEGKRPEGDVSVRMNLATGAAEVVTEDASPVEQSEVSYEGTRVDLETLDMDTLTEAALTLAQASGVSVEGLKAKERGAPELKFRVLDAEGRIWQTSYGMLNGKLSAKAADEASGFNLYSALTRLHKQHHYPDVMGARWFWSFFADITALTLVFWGLSGAIMWWQMKPTRLIGIGGLSVAAVLAAIIFAGTLDHLSWKRSRDAVPPRQEFSTQASQVDAMTQSAEPKLAESKP